MIYVDTKEKFEEALSQLRKATILAVDFECENNLHHYGSFLCLIQVSDGKHVWIIDVVALTDISEFCVILEDPTIIKIFHDVNFDYRILHANYDCHPKNTFDTKIVSDILQKEKASLDNLIRIYFGKEISYSGQKADWTKRPIKRELLEYAAFDVLFLIPLREKLLEELRLKNLMNEAEDKLSALDTKAFTTMKATHRNLPGYMRQHSDVKKRAKRLFELREKTAEKLDKPVYMILHNKKLMELAQNPPKTLDSWKAMKGVHPIVKTEKWFSTCK